MPDKSSVSTISFPGGVHKRFEKTCSRMVYHAICGGPKRPDNLPLGWLSAEGGPEGPGIGVHPNKRPMAVIGHRDIACRLSNMISESIAC